MLGQILLDQGSANLSCKGPDSNYTIFSLAGGRVSVAAIQLGLYSRKADLPRQPIANRLGSAALTFYLTGAQRDLALGPKFADCHSSDWAKKKACIPRLYQLIALPQSNLRPEIKGAKFISSKTIRSTECPYPKPS